MSVLAATALAEPSASYEGVVPGTAHTAPRTSASPAADAPSTLDWLGFQPRPGGASRFFVQLSRATPHTVALSEARVVLHFPRTRAPLDNTLRPIDTRYFATPARGARVERRPEGALAVVIELRAPARPVVSTQAAEGGRHFVYVDFGPQ